MSVVEERGVMAAIGLLTTGCLERGGGFTDIGTD